MLRSQIILLLCTIFSGNTYAQKLDKTVKKHLSSLRHIEGGSFMMGSGVITQIPDEDSLLAVPSSARKVTVSSFYISATEVSNNEWREFHLSKVDELGKEAAAQYLPDTSCWERDMKGGIYDPMILYYYTHPAFDDYPVVGITWEQANAYCQWKSDEVNAIMKNQGLDPIPDFRLPTEAEWEYAAKGGQEFAPYPWTSELGHYDYRNMKGHYRCNFGVIRDNYGVWAKSHIDDGYENTAPVKTYVPNIYGLYNLSGNVAEWTMDHYRHALLPTEVNDLNPLHAQDSINESKLEFNNTMPDSMEFVNYYIHRQMHINDALKIDTSKGSDYRTEILDVQIRYIWREMLYMSKYPNKEFGVVKGGGWISPLAYIRIGSRVRMPRDHNNSFTGFRLAMTRVAYPEPKGNSNKTSESKKKSTSTVTGIAYNADPDEEYEFGGKVKDPVHNFILKNSPKIKK